MNKTLKELNEEFLLLEEETQGTLYKMLREANSMEGHDPLDEHSIVMAIAIKKDILKLAENYPGVAFAIHAADMNLPRALKDISKLQESNQSVPLTKYSYSKKNQTIN